MKGLLRFIINTCLALIIVSAIFSTFLFFNTDEDGVISINDTSLIPITNSDLSPTVEEMDLIFVKAITNYDDIAKNDVISYKKITNEKMTIETKRVYLINKTDDGYTFITKTDTGNVANQDTVKASDIIGKWNNQKVLFVGAYFEFITSIIGFIAVVIIPLTVLVILLIATIIQKQKKVVKEAEEDNISVETNHYEHTQVLGKITEDNIMDYDKKKLEVENSEVAKGVKEEKPTIQEEVDNVEQILNKEATAEETKEVKKEEDIEVL